MPVYLSMIMKYLMYFEAFLKSVLYYLIGVAKADSLGTEWRVVWPYCHSISESLRDHAVSVN